MSLRGLAPTLALLATLSCSRATPPGVSTREAPTAAPRAPLEDAAPPVPESAPPASTPTEDAAPPSPPAPTPTARSLPLDGDRTTYYVPGATPDAVRVVGHLHGICYPPSYSCGKWATSAARLGFLVCPTGNARCGDAPNGPPSWEAPSWGELVSVMDRDLERAIASVGKRHSTLSREGAILTGFSRGAYAAPQIAKSHPGRWPHLVLVEAAVPLSIEGLAVAQVRAVAFVAGERGPEIEGERKIVDGLVAKGFSARLFVMKGAAHFYSDDVDDVMREALDWVIAAGGNRAPRGAQ